MRRTFECNESMFITIPIGNLKSVAGGQLMPEKFSCVFRDTYKVFIHSGKPKPLGAVQAITGVFLCSFGLIMTNRSYMTYTLPSVLFVVCGLLTYAAGKAPHMPVAKLSFSLNIISFFWSIAAFSWSLLIITGSHDVVNKGVNGLIMSLLALENVLAFFLIYWLSKAVCRQHFNTLPIIMLKQGD